MFISLSSYEMFSVSLFLFQQAVISPFPLLLDGVLEGFCILLFYYFVPS